MYRIGTVLVWIMTVVGLSVNSTAQADDVHSYARLNQVSTPHLDLELAIDFEARQLRGHATYTLLRHDDTNRIYLDTSELDIARTELWVNEQWQPTKFTLGEVHPSLGRELIVDIGNVASKVRIHYATSPA